MEIESPRFLRQEGMVDEPKRPARNSMRPSGLRDPDRTRRAILQAATDEFVAKGFAGASVNEIAERANVNKRMLYHYFGKKDDLYIAAFERAYTAFRTAQSQLRLTDLPPEDAIRKLILFTWTYYIEHPELLSLFNTENILRGRFAARSEKLKGVHEPLRTQLDAVIEQGQREKMFRESIDVLQLYLTIAALASHFIAGRFTISGLAGKDMTTPDEMERRAEHIVEVVLSYMKR